MEEIERLRKGIRIIKDKELLIKSKKILMERLSESEKEKDKVKIGEGGEIEKSESIVIGEEIVKEIKEWINESKDKLKMLDIMKETYYYLGRYLFEYYMVALEFGIAKEKQFFAPREHILWGLAKRLSVFYYTPKKVMTISMPPGMGKEQPLSSKILTPNGWATMSEIKIGSKVISASGKETEVIGVFPQGKKEVYEVTFDDKSKVECGKEHLWEVSKKEDKRRKIKGVQVKTLEEIMKDYKTKEKNGNNRYKYSVKLVKPIEYNKKTNERDLKPYLLGALLGDGGLSRQSLKFTSADEEILEKIKKELPNEDKITYYDKYDYGISRKEDKRDKKGYHIPCETKKRLIEYKLQGRKSNEKYIPNKYLYGTIDERLQLLRGLMDTDGSIEKNGINCEFSSCSKKLSEDLLEIVRSLGGKGTINENASSYKKNGVKIKCKNRYRVRFRLNINPFYLKRKADRWKEPKVNYKKKIINIEKVRIEESQCIMVSDSEHLYVTDGYTLTHNTECGKRFMSWCVGKEPDLPNMMISYSASIAKDKFYNGIMTIVEDEWGNYQQMFPGLKTVYQNAETMSLDYRNDDKKRPHSEYTLYCAGFDGSITGRTRAHNVLYVDDLIKNIEEARNRDVLDKKWEEFTGTLKKRMQGNCKMLIIGTIFSLHDPLSKIIAYYEEKYPKRIEVIKIPGLNERNESNFNYKYGQARTTEDFLEDKDLMDNVSFECLIQQNPIERDGVLIDRNILKHYEELPDESPERIIGACDVAWGGGDYLSLPIGYEYKNGDVYIVDVIYLNDKKEITIPIVVNKIIEHKVTKVHFEANNGGDMYAEKVREELLRKGYKCNITWAKVPTNKSKLDRILSEQSVIEGNSSAEYRYIYRSSKTSNKNYITFIDDICKFNQKLSIQGKQIDDGIDSLASLSKNVLESKSPYARVNSYLSRKELGI